MDATNDYYERRKRSLISQRKRARRILGDMSPDRYRMRKAMEARLRQIEGELSLIDTIEANALSEA